MIQIFFKNIYDSEDFQDNDYLSFFVEGHSKLEKSGKDIVCAAVSVLTLSTVMTIEKLKTVNQNIKQSLGYLKSELFLEDIVETDLLILMFLLSCMITGLKEIEKLYPENLKLIFDKKDVCYN